MVERHLDEGRSGSSKLRSGVDREADRVVVRVPALVGVGQDRLGLGQVRQQAPRDLGQPVGRALVGDPEAVMPRCGHAREVERRAGLCPPRGRVGPGIRKPMAERVAAVARRAIRDVDHDDARQARQQRAATQSLVVRMRYHDEPASVRRQVRPRWLHRRQVAGACHLSQRSASGCRVSAISRRPARVAGCNGSNGWRTASLAITPPAIITALAARRPHWRFS
jgi:hypothetical protein